MIPTFLPRDVERFWSKVARSDDCWKWRGYLSKGYGQFYMRTSFRYQAHRVSYYLETGHWPPAGMMVCHHCDNPPCVRPDHLFLGTPRDNALDMVAKRRNVNVTKPWAIVRGDRHGSHTKPENRPRGSAHGLSKLTEAQAIEIIASVDAGEPRLAIAKRYGVSLSTIWRIARGEIWKHINNSAAAFVGEG